jgi:hypothetical protein
VVGEEACEESGECDDPDLIYESIQEAALQFPSLSNAANGVCITPLEPNNVPPCPLLRNSTVLTLDFTTQRGCVRFSECLYETAGFPTECDHSPATEELCISEYGGSWLSLPIQTKEACENPLGVSEADSPGFCRISNAIPYLSPKGRGECEECGGAPVPPAVWKAETWKGGQFASPSWREAELVPTFYYVSNSISYFKLEELFEKAALEFENFILWSGESCLVDPFVGILDTMSCDCAFDGNVTIPDQITNPFNEGFNLTNLENCRSRLATEEIGAVWFCPNVDLQVGVISGVVTTLSEYVGGDICFFSDITLASESDFVGNRPSEPRTVFNDPNDLDPSPVRNRKGASVGEVLGDGVRLMLSENVQPVNWAEEVQGVQFTFVVDLSVFEDKNIPPTYILDFGMEVVNSSLKTQPSGEIELRPLNATIGRSVGQPIQNFLPEDSTQQAQLPITIEGVLLDPFRYQQPARVYPIARIADEHWEDRDTDDALSHGEVILIGVFTALYGIAFLISLAFMLKGLHMLNFSLLMLFLYVLSTFLFRTVFLAIVASGDYEETSAGYYILIEPPSFFILSVLTILIMSYAFIVGAAKGGANLGLYWASWLVLQLFLIMVLFVVVGLMIGLDTNDDITISCFGRQSTVSENTTIRDIRIAYHSFILTVAIICALLVLKLGKDLPEHDNKGLLQALSGLAGLSVVATSLLWVIYSAIDDPSPYFVIPLFVTEVPPLVIMSYLTFPKGDQVGPESAEMDSHQVD